MAFMLNPYYWWIRFIKKRSCVPSTSQWMAFKIKYLLPLFQYSPLINGKQIFFWWKREENKTTKGEKTDQVCNRSPSLSFNKIDPNVGGGSSQILIFSPEWIPTFAKKSALAFPSQRTCCSFIDQGRFNSSLTWIMVPANTWNRWIWFPFSKFITLLESDSQIMLRKPLLQAKSRPCLTTKIKLSKKNLTMPITACETNDPISFLWTNQTTTPYVHGRLPEATIDIQLHKICWWGLP